MINSYLARTFRAFSFRALFGVPSNGPYSVEFVAAESAGVQYVTACEPLDSVAAFVTGIEHAEGMPQ